MATALYLTLLVFVQLCWARGANINDNDADHMLNNMKVMQETVSSLLDTVDKQTKEIQGLKKEIQWLKSDKYKRDGAIELQKEELESLKREFVQPKTSNITVSADTLFLATISAESIPISDEEVIVFDTDPINPGGHYNTIVGGYTAPFNGYYQFSVTKESNDYRCMFYILVDEQRFAQYHITLSTDAGGNPSCSATINIQLTAGQIVRIENEASTIIYGTNSDGIRSWFTGHMLYAL